MAASSILAESLPFTVDDLDIMKIFTFSGVDYKLRLRQNTLDDSFSMDVFDKDEVFLYNSKLNYKTNFVDALSVNLPFQIIPLDITELFGNLNHETEITSDNLGDTVKLYTGLTVQ